MERQKGVTGRRVGTQRGREREMREEERGEECMKILLIHHPCMQTCGPSCTYQGVDRLPLGNTHQCTLDDTDSSLL